MGKDGVAAPQARSVTRALRPPSSVQRSCRTELLGSRFAHCAAVGRRGYCRPAASSSAAARGAHGCIGSSMAPDHCVPRLLCPFRSMLRRWQCLPLPPQFAADLRDQCDIFCPGLSRLHQGVCQPAGCVSCEPVCVFVSLVRVVIICPASTHTALVSSPSLTVVHLSTYIRVVV